MDEAADFRDRIHEARIQAATTLATIANRMTEAPQKASSTGSLPQRQDCLNLSFLCFVVM